MSYEIDRANHERLAQTEFAPFQNMIAFQEQPRAVQIRIHKMVLQMCSETAVKIYGWGTFGAQDFFPRPQEVPAHAQAVEFNGLWFWGWSNEE